MNVEAFLNRMDKQKNSGGIKSKARHQSLNNINSMPKAKSANPRINKKMRYQPQSNPNPFVQKEDYSRSQLVRRKQFPPGYFSNIGISGIGHHVSES